MCLLYILYCFLLVVEKNDITFTAGGVQNKKKKKKDFGNDTFSCNPDAKWYHPFYSTQCDPGVVSAFLEIRHFCQLIGVCVFCSFLSNVSLFFRSQKCHDCLALSCALQSCFVTPPQFLRNVVSSCNSDRNCLLHFWRMDNWTAHQLVRTFIFFPSHFCILAVLLSFLLLYYILVFNGTAQSKG